MKLRLVNGCRNEIFLSYSVNVLQVSALHTHTHTVRIPERSVKAASHYLIEQLQLSRLSRLNLENSRPPTPVAKEQQEVKNK
jgi:hypothetical protein